MKVYIKESAFHNEDKNERISAIYEYVDRLNNGLYKFEDINTQACECFFVSYYLAQVLNGGLTQFFRNVISIYQVEYGSNIWNGLSNMGAPEMQKLFEEADSLFWDLEDREMQIEYITGTWYYDQERKLDKLPTKLKELYRKHKELSNKFFDIYSNREDLEDLTYHYITKIENLSIVPDNEYDNLIEQLLNALPNHQERLDAQAADSPTAFIEEICEKFHQKFISLEWVDFGEDIVSDDEVESNIDNDMRYFHITTNLGDHYIKINLAAGISSLFQSESDQLIGDYKLKSSSM